MCTDGAKTAALPYRQITALVTGRCHVPRRRLRTTHTYICVRSHFRHEDVSNMHPEAVVNICKTTRRHIPRGHSLAMEDKQRSPVFRSVHESNSMEEADTCLAR
jgi:hypothetical protein